MSNGADTVRTDVSLVGKAEINACEDRGQLLAWLDSFEEICIRLETSLQFPNPHSEERWFNQTKGALAAHRIECVRISNRLKRTFPSEVAIKKDEDLKAAHRENYLLKEERGRLVNEVRKLKKEYADAQATMVLLRKEARAASLREVAQLREAIPGRLNGIGAQ